jgi:O-antigen/teichoic acid export membrane protein
MLGIKIFKHDFFKASSVVLAGAILANVLNYLFNLVMGRLLAPVEFGEVASLMGLAVVASVPSATLVRLMAKYTAGFRARDEFGAIRNLFKFIGYYSFVVGLAMFVIFLALVPSLSSFFQLEESPLFVFSLVFPVSLMLAVNQGMFQGLQQFFHFSVMAIIAAAGKLVLAVLFVKIGFSVSGVVGAYVAGSVVAYAYGLLKLSPQLKVQGGIGEEKISSKMNWQEILSSASVLFWASIFMVLFFNVDIVLAKHYLDPYLAGQYAALSIAGKIILYGPAAFVTVMFPMISSARANGNGEEKKILKMSFVIVAGVVVLVMLLFISLPELTIKLLFGDKYLSVVPYLGLFGLAMTFGTIAQVFINYFMAGGANRFLVPLGLVVFLQMLLIAFFHSSIWQITGDMLASSFLMLVAMVVTYYRQINLKNYE